MVMSGVTVTHLIIRHGSDEILVMFHAVARHWTHLRMRKLIHVVAHKVEGEDHEIELSQDMVSKVISIERAFRCLMRIAFFLDEPAYLVWRGENGVGAVAHHSSAD
jgi:hypothetical protein